MASPPGLFYAYAKNDTNDWSARYLITFASRAVADDWWRTITLSVQQGYTRFSHVIRHSIQFYSFNSDLANICDTLTDGNVTGDSNLSSKVFFTLLNDRDSRVICPAPVLNYTEHRSGDMFYVRSMLQPDVFWFYDLLVGVIRPSTTRRTRFTIAVVDPEQRLGPDPIMIGQDRITISVGRADLDIYFLHDGLHGFKPHEIVGEIKPVKFDFSAFDGGFEIRFPRPDVGLQDAVIFPINNRTGERWELV